jgi:hypothetical protein
MIRSPMGDAKWLNVQQRPMATTVLAATEMLAMGMLAMGMPAIGMPVMGMTANVVPRMERRQILVGVTFSRLRPGPAWPSD